jgi:uncharacterized protein (UPF0332 family)
MIIGTHELMQKRLRQAREALADARVLNAEGMDIGFVLNSLSFAFYYPVIALVCRGRVPETMQRVTIGLFDQQFIETGIMPERFSHALRRVFELKPSCSGGSGSVTSSEVEHLFMLAEEFIVTVEHHMARNAQTQS